MSLLKRIGLAIALAFSIFLGSAATADATEICVPPLVCATVTLPVEVPVTVRLTSTVTDYVTKPAVTLPRQTVTSTVTKTVKVPEPVTTTDVVRVPGPTVTRVVTEKGHTGQTATSRATVTQTVTQTITPTPTEKTMTSTVNNTVEVTKVRNRGGVITVERVKTVGISIGLVLLGALLSLIAMYITYVVGYKDSELENEKRAENLLTELFARKK